MAVDLGVGDWSVGDASRSGSEGLLQNVRIRRLDAFVIVLFRFDHFEAKLLIKIYSAFIIHLDMSANGEKSLRKCNINTE